MKRLFYIQIAITILVIVGLMAFNTTQNAVSFALGAALFFGNLAFYAWVYRLISGKKLIAGSLFLIVIKYALLIYGLLYLLKTSFINWEWVFAGLATGLPTMLIYSGFRSEKTEVVERK